MKHSGSSSKLAAQGNPAALNNTLNSTILDESSPHYKAGRVKVAIRVRPPFQDEVDAFKGPGSFSPIVDARSEAQLATADGNNSSSNPIGKVTLKVSNSKQREFWFDYAFGPSASQDFVYNRVARPVVQDVLRGFNGTIFAYGE